MPTDDRLKQNIERDSYNPIQRKVDRYKEEILRRRNRSYYHSSAAGPVFAALIVLFGLALLLDNLDIVQFHDLWKYWPVFLIAYGVSRILTSRVSSRLIWGGEVALIGALILLNNLDVVRFSFDYIWPLAIIALGLGMLVRTLDRRLHIGRGMPPTATGGPGSL